MMKTIARTLIQLMLATAFLIPTVVHAATYYVATNGSDSSPGTLAQPFRTINKGVRVLTAGDTLFVRGGIYTEGVNVNSIRGTSWANPITIKAYPGEVPTVRPSANDPYNAFFFDGNNFDTSYIILDGFILDGVNSPYTVVQIWVGAHHIRIINNLIKNSNTGNGIFITYLPDGFPLPRGVPSHSNEIINNKIFNNGLAVGVPPGTGIQHHHGIYDAGPSTLIEGNEIYGNGNTGIVSGSDYLSPTGVPTIIRYNYIHDNGQGNAAAYSPKPVQGTGIFLSAGHSNNRFIVQSNIVTGSTGNGDVMGIWITGVGSAVYNNTVYNNKLGTGIYNAGRDSIIINNIVWNNGSTGAYGPIGGPGGGANISNNLTTDPLFISAATGDFRLKPDSPAIGAGVPISEVTHDFAGVARPQGSSFAIGAYEYASQTTRPLTPLNLRVTPE